jgi:serine phosphatase RsbU (regulator of sigma subunit)
MTKEKRHKVLLVDDEVDNLELLQRTFRYEYEVFTATSGAEALKVVEENPDIALIISDQRMPGMSGVEFLAKTLDSHRHTIRMILTGYTDVEDLIGAINSGQVYRYITKPWEPQELRITVKRALESYELSLENEAYRKQLIETARVRRELEIAREIQQSLLPSSAPEIPGFEIAAISHPAREVGGDLYGFYGADSKKGAGSKKTKDGRLEIAIGDVSGKGLPAAIYAAVSAGMLRMRPTGERSSLEVMRHLNTAFYEDDSETFVCLTYAILDSKESTFSVANSGLTHPLYAGRRRAAFIEVDGLPLGVAEEIDCDEKTVKMEGGDIIVLSSDGVVEAMNPRGRLFGEKRFLELVRTHRGLSASEIIEKIVAGVTEFIGPAPQHDDLTLVVIKALE